jgi:putative transposase
MPRANRYFLPGHVWHITHRCHKKEFLLKFAKDRKRWLHWLFEARKRFGLCVLNYIIFGVRAKTLSSQLFPVFLL